MRCYLNQLGIINSLGGDRDSVLQSLLSGSRAGLNREVTLLRGGRTTVAEWPGPLPAIEPPWRHYNSRNNRLLLAALNQIREAVDAAIQRHGPQRVAVVLGSSTSGVREGEQAVAADHHGQPRPSDYHYRQQEVGSPSDFLADFLAVTGPAMTISTACTSSAKSIIAGARLLQAGLCDVVLAGGVDSLCGLTVNGFDALESVSAGQSNPFSRRRDGINIGEGAALFLMSREAGGLSLMGWGETSDAHHISAPDPEGRGAEAAMRAALDQAGRAAGDVAYLNLHGTGTIKNDLMESHAVARVFPEGVACGSSKGMTGHTLGAAGATEAAFCWLALHPDHGDGRLPPHVWDGEADPALAPLSLIDTDSRVRGGVRLAMSNSFAFGGSNAVLLIGDA
ncbi:beta-ketoacyl-[acyl-carrier-protein] synthase family protein [Natronospira bacteriovora]|uniref:Beta-ketoacyl-[acyl-carrier-protein] synthase family protein n=1 Tax=Natronospira bacteriovora TaxID=3069753 RepID=A0ABU0W7H8_9GAMM|nr:beta-ketoacyl-[acyl-carrier-protein] synthase family protein [Natronospira sp. AB-CW4]MDQ2069984.1 beta-ketoacyl-[acyl-carrier-protein] synthase family protein [Natronospira sp. AB-CW4]